MAESNDATLMEENMSFNQSKRELLRNKRKEQKRRNTITFILITLAAVILILAAVILPNILMSRSKYANSRGFALGDPNAPITVVQFSSYSCGFCKDFADRMEDDFINTYVDPGYVYYRYVNIPSNTEQSQAAAEASYCAADQNRFFDYKDYLYTYATTPDGFTFSNLMNYANSAGLETEEFRTCLESGTFANAYIDDIQYTQRAGVTGTPTFLVNDQLVSSTGLIPAVEALLTE